MDSSDRIEETNLASTERLSITSLPKTHVPVVHETGGTDLMLNLRDLQSDVYTKQLKTLLETMISRRHATPPWCESNQRAKRDFSYSIAKGIPLSKALNQNPRLFTSTKITVVEKRINEIDLLPEAYRQIQVRRMKKSVFLIDCRFYISVKTI